MPKKIFELAKELDLKPLDLVEGLKAKGFAVRNHMSSLTDEEVDKFMQLRTAEVEKKAEGTKKKKTKKKTTKKKKVAKKTTKKTVKADDKAEEKKVTEKKKTVIRRKVKVEKVVKEETPAQVIEETEELVVAEAPEAVTDESGGLRVVSHPEVIKPVEEPPVVEEKKEEKKEIYREKMHRFTPVYTPPPKEEKEKEKEKTSETKKTDATAAPTTKKRLGGLASIVSGKRAAGISRSQVLLESRSSQELKSYSTLSTLGRPLYTQVKRKKIFHGKGDKTELTEVKQSKRVIRVHGGCSIEELAQKLSTKSKNMIDKLLDVNLLVRPDDFVGVELAREIAVLYEYRVEDKAFDEDEVIGKEQFTEEEKSNLPFRNPIIAIMGHVDHGKTTLLDHIRSAKVVEGEAGGITQHIGAYSVDVKGKTLTFLDTPGHAAFASMRQRGADVTDIVVLVVAADDGVMPQTKESIKFCQKSGVPVIVAVNKMDKEGVNPERIKTELAEFSITPEDWGGDTQFVPISALKGEGIDELLEAIALQSEILELRADPKGKAEGVVIESKIEQGRGPVATVLVQTGTLKKGDNIVVGECVGRARSLTNHLGKDIKSAGPSVPVQILGLDKAPGPGDLLNVVKNEREGKKIIQNRIDQRKEIEAGPVKKKMSLEDFFANAKSEGPEQRSLNLLVRADVQGSFEAIKQSLEGLENQEVKVKFIGGGVGPVTDSDVMLADSADGYIIGFNMRPSTSARRLAEEKGVEVKTYSIIYELISDIKLALEGLLEPEFVEEYVGRAEVKEPFLTPKAGTIAGSGVIDGKIVHGCNIRLLRNGKIVFDGHMSSLRRFKDDVKEVRSGMECGIGLEDFNDIKTGDLFEAYIIKERKRTLEEVEKEEAKIKEEVQANP
ncbi:MAG: translation initiation factor IF-2 [Epsilonproteobacteria bacterium]|nr:MAG: translation initiation factor IF-2 [Campylobacterota bacterium]RLA65192.1 MAG: translation initiation factor IF-2 [Campylobacterota bacterium]